MKTADMILFIDKIFVWINFVKRMKNVRNMIIIKTEDLHRDSWYHQRFVLPSLTGCELNFWGLKELKNNGTLPFLH
jgi:hypothetical protein